MLNKINFYQFDNLINNRVPFLFFNSSENLGPWYTSVSKMHIDTYQILCKHSDILSLIAEKQTAKDYAIVLLCSDGLNSLEIYSQLEKLAYTNVYVIDGGYQQMVTERSEI